LGGIARRILAAERRDACWQLTELVQEAYLRLLDWRGVHWLNRAHFFSTAVGMMWLYRELSNGPGGAPPVTARHDA